MQLAFEYVFVRELENVHCCLLAALVILILMSGLCYSARGVAGV